MINARMLECENARMVTGCYSHNFLIKKHFSSRPLHFTLRNSVIKSKQETSAITQEKTFSHSCILAFKNHLLLMFKWFNLVVIIKMQTTGPNQALINELFLSNESN